MNKLKDTSSVGFAEASTVGFPSGIRKKGHMHRRCLEIQYTAERSLHFQIGEIQNAKRRKQAETQPRNLEKSLNRTEERSSHCSSIAIRRDLVPALHATITVPLRIMTELPTFGAARLIASFLRKQ